MLAQLSLDFAELDAEATELDLLIDAAQDLDPPVGQVAGQVTGTVKPGCRLQDGRLPVIGLRVGVATIRLAVDYDEGRAVQVDTKIVGGMELWFEKDERQRVLWPATVRLSLDYYESLSRHAVPLDERAIAALAHSAMALDVYCWLAQLTRPLS